MTAIFVDTNVWIRHFTQDSPFLAARTSAFLKRAEQGTIEISVTETVLLETEYILTSPAQGHHFDRHRAAAALRMILGLGGLRLAVDLYEENPIDPSDRQEADDPSILKTDPSPQFSLIFRQILLLGSQVLPYPIEQ